MRPPRIVISYSASSVHAFKLARMLAEYAKIKGLRVGVIARSDRAGPELVVITPLGVYSHPEDARHSIDVLASRYRALVAGA